jgi:hypothetical protein
MPPMRQIGDLREATDQPVGAPSGAARRGRRRHQGGWFVAMLAGILVLLALISYAEKDIPQPTCATLAVAADGAPVHRVDVLIDRTADDPPVALPAGVSAAIVAEAQSPEHATVTEVGVIQGPSLGGTFWASTGYRSRPRTHRPDQQAAYGQHVARCVEEAAAHARPVVPNSDVLGALQYASRQRSTSDMHNTILAVTNGLANAGSLDLRRWMAGDASVADVIAAVRQQGELPEFAGAEVRFFGIGEVGGHARVLSTGERAWLVRFWRKLCFAAHGFGCTVDESVSPSNGVGTALLPDA